MIALTDTSGTFAEYYEYDVFGEPTIWDANAQEIVESSVVGNPFMFTGRRYDSETGLYYYRARYYDPYIGRFLQTDPIRYAAGLNLYTYCGNNPVNFTDPYGLEMPGWLRYIYNLLPYVGGRTTQVVGTGAGLAEAAGHVGTIAYRRSQQHEIINEWDRIAGGEGPLPTPHRPKPPKPPEGPDSPTPGDGGGDDGGGDGGGKK